MLPVAAPRKPAIVPSTRWDKEAFTFYIKGLARARCDPFSVEERLLAEEGRVVQLRVC